MLSKKAKYGIRTLVYLAKHSRSGPVLSRKIAAVEKMPKKYLESILLELKNAGFLDSKPGKGGGYVLRLSPGAIKLSQIIRILNGPLALVPCLSQTAFSSCVDCPGGQKCALSEVMKQVHEATIQILDRATLENLVKEDYRLNTSSDDFGVYI